eukprot:6213624-Pleurochrysis_carterae.AAC.1
MASCAARAVAASCRPTFASGENVCNSCRSHASTGTSSAAYAACSMATTAATAAAVAACAAAVAARATQTRNPLRSRTEQHAVPNGSGGHTGPCADDTAGHAPSAAGGEPAVDDGSQSDCADCDDDDAEDEESSEQQKNDETPPRVKSKHKKLWCNDLFPRGSDGANNYEMENLGKLASCTVVLEVYLPRSSLLLITGQSQHY